MSDAMTASTAPPESFLATERGKAILAVLCLATFLDVMDGAIVNVAMPTIRTHLGFSVQNLQWVLSGYMVTYGGFLLLGGRAGDLIGRRRLLVAGTALFAAASLACGLAGSQGLLVGARLVQGFGAAMMTPAALSILTTPSRAPTGTRRWVCGPGSAGWPRWPGWSSAGCSPRSSAGGGCSSSAFRWPRWCCSGRSGS
jgi:MFS family permease